MAKETFDWDSAEKETEKIQRQGFWPGAEAKGGESILGTVAEFRKGEPNRRFKEARRIMVLATRDGEERLIGCTAVLEKRLESLEVKVGDRIGIKYFGQTEPKKKGSPGIHIFEVKKF